MLHLKWEHAIRTYLWDAAPCAECEIKQKSNRHEYLMWENSSKILCASKADLIAFDLRRGWRGKTLRAYVCVCVQSCGRRLKRSERVQSTDVGIMRAGKCMFINIHWRQASTVDARQRNRQQKSSRRRQGLQHAPWQDIKALVFGM